MIFGDVGYGGGNHQMRRRSNTAVAMRVTTANQVIGDQQKGMGQVDRRGRAGQIGVDCLTQLSC